MNHTDQHYTGLTKTQPTLPAHYYFDPGHYARELDAIWYRDWVYVCHANDLDGPGAFRRIEIGTQSILVVRDEADTLHAFHNTCRHRGARLCTEPQGQFGSARIVCPYHRWSYALSGELQRAGSGHCPDGFEMQDYPLYEVAVDAWQGFIFVNLLGAAAPPLAESFQPDSANLDDWPLQALRTGHTYRKTMACNWKVFWENFNECLHCPGVHPELSKMVPIYKRGYMEPNDDPQRAAQGTPDLPQFAGGMRAGAKTWSVDGQLVGQPFANLSAAQRKTAYHYVVNRPSLFIAAHVDYVRAVRLLPLGPEQTELQVEWLFSEATLAAPDANIQSAIDFTRIVMDQDAAVAELNQQGLHSIRHQHGVLMAEEYDVHDFQNWVRAQLG